jgi:hypothetical protein
MCINAATAVEPIPLFKIDKKFYMKKNVLTLLCCLWACTVFAQTWTGSVSTDWNTPGNWSGNAVPISSGNVIIPGNLDNYPVLASDVTINRIDMQSGSMLDFNGFQLSILTTILNYSYFTGATLKSSSQLITLNVNNGTSGFTTSMSGCTIEDDIVINLTGSNPFYEGDGAANVFQGNATFNVGGSGALWTSYSATSTYQGNVTVNRTVGGLLDLFNTGGNVAGNLSVTNPIGNGGIRIGTAAHATVIQGTISIDANYNALPNVFEMTRVINNTTGGIIDVKNSYGFNLRNDTLRLSDLRIKGFRGASFSYLYNNDITASVDIADSSTSGSGYHTYIRSNIFTGSVLLERNGDINLYEADANNAANVFNGPLQINANGTGDVYLSYVNASTYNGNVTVQCNGNGIMSLFNAGGTINGNLIYNNNSTGNNLFGAAAARTLVTGTIQVNISNSNAGLFEMKRVINQTNGGNIFTSGTRGFEFLNDTLLLNQLSVQDVQGSAFGTIYNSLLTADISVADRNTTGNGFHIYMRNTNVNGNVTFTMNSQRYLYVGDNSNQPFTISGNLQITVNGTGPVYASQFSTVHVGGDVTINRSGAGLVELYRTGATIGGNFSYTSNSQSEVSIGNASSSTVISGTININANYPNPEPFTVERVINQTAGGSIYVSGSRGFTLNRDTLLADITLVEFRSTAFATLYNSEITGNTYISPSTNASNGFNTYVRSTVFNGEVRHFSTSINNYYDSDAGTGNVYNGLVRYERTGSGVFSVGNIQNTYNGDLTMIDNSGVIARALFSASTGSSLSMNGNTINFLTLNTPQLVMNSDVRINNTLTFQSGLITLNPLSPSSKIIFNDNASHTGASVASHVVLTVQKEGNDVFTFPVGSGALYAPVSMNAPASGSVFSVKYIPENPDDASLDTSSRAGTLQKITGFEYWEITRDAGTSTPTFTFAYNDPAPGVANYITDPASVRIARWNGTLWDNAGNTAFTGTTSGTITSAVNISEFGFFTFGTTNPDTNPFMTQAFVYYRDLDGDGFGDVNNFITSGSPTPPTGYVINSLDCDDTQLLYADNDNDGYGTGAPTPCGVANNTDCNDGDNTIYPTAPELCDGKDNDCNGLVDDGVGTVWYQDSDGDGFGNVDVAQTACTQPTGYVSNSTDCNDSDNTIYPGATEVCDGVDNNCNGQVDEGVGTVWYQDSDGDGFGNIDVPQTACTQPTGYVTNGLDCNDNDDSIYPGAPELCDGKDNDCNGTIDDGAGTITFYRDADGDGFGDAGVTATACSAPVGYVTNDDDCDDADDTVYPGAPELCDGKDNDCNGQVDDGIGATWYIDSDSDGFGDVNTSVVSCTQPAGYVTNSLDCDDADDTVYPGAPELCDGKDNDCDGQTDEDGGVTWYIDSDSDGFGDVNTSVVSCTQPAGYVTNSLDCDDADDTIYPGAPELCDGKDNDCDGQVDEGVIPTWYLDADSDGFGDANVPLASCTQPAGYVTNNLDCDDAEDTVYPGAPELCDGKDNDCNGLVDDNAGTYNISASANAGGSISPNGNVSVSCGDDQTFLITADPGFVIFDVLVDGVSNGAISSYTFSDVSTTHTIVAFFSAIGTNDYTITASAGTGGIISPSGTTTVSQGSNITYTITADPCYAVADVVVNGNSIGAVTSYTFNNVNANQTIDVSFAYMPAPGPFTGVVNVCPFEGTTQELTYSVPDMPGVLSYNWVVPPTVSLVSGQGTNSINITINNGFGASANKQLRVYAVWPCGNSALSIYYLLAQGPTTPQPIVASSDDVCNSIATATGITYTIPKVNAATAYNWTTPAGTVSVVHPNGAGENDTVVVITYGAAFTGGTVSVQAVNNCAVSGVRNLSVVRKQPSTPGLITGPVNVCEYVGPSGSLATYTVGNDPTITEYVWSLPAGATDVSGQGTAQISFRYPVGYTGGSISVTAGNGCGVSTPRVLRVSTLSPGAPGAITVTNTLACPDRQFTYSLAAMPSGSTSVWWTVPAGATIVSGQGTLSILVAYPSNALAGTVTATGVNGCSSGNTRTIQVKLPECVVAGDVPEYVKQTTQKTELNAQIFPNPSYDVFNIIARTNSNEKIQVIIMDIQGRKLLGSNLVPNQPNTVGAGLKPGVYFAEIIQGSQRIIRKILKQ